MCAASALQEPAQAPLEIQLDDVRHRLIGHRLYSLIDRPERLRRFMEFHIWAVWDFQSLLKAMQQRLTCTQIPWVPTPDPEARRLVNEIVLEEESDELPGGGFASHFECYLQAMKRAGANTDSIEKLLPLIASGLPLAQALDAAQPPKASADFVKNSFAIIESGAPHTVVAAFTYGREDVIPDMFRNLVGSLAQTDPDTWEGFRFYLERHITHDDEKHAPMCRRILSRLCGEDPRKWAEASACARRCLEARIALWDAIAEEFAPC
ncbi:MAG: hypothetical protein RLZZ399_532 [Verrucomicrobiota bacterium]